MAKYWQIDHPNRVSGCQLEWSNKSFRFENLQSSIEVDVGGGEHRFTPNKKMCMYLSNEMKMPCVSPKEGETRIDYLMRVLETFMDETPAGDCLIRYDNAECDGVCLVTDLKNHINPNG